MTKLRQCLRQKKGRNPDPTGAIIDSQSVKGTPESYVESGFEGGKLVKGRKRHIVVDTMGCLLFVWVHAANVYDGKAARQVITNLFLILHTISKIWGDSAYSCAKLANWVFFQFGCLLEAVKKKKGLRGFHVLTPPLGSRENICLAWLIASIE